MNSSSVFFLDHRRHIVSYVTDINLHLSDVFTYLVKNLPFWGNSKPMFFLLFFVLNKSGPEYILDHTIFHATTKWFNVLKVMIWMNELSNIYIFSTSFILVYLFRTA